MICPSSVCTVKKHIHRRSPQNIPGINPKLEAQGIFRLHVKRKHPTKDIKNIITWKKLTLVLFCTL